MLRQNKLIHDQIKEASTIIQDALNDTALHEALAARGRSIDLIAEGDALLRKLRDRFDAQLKTYSARFAATEHANEKLDQLIREYMIHVDMARSIFRDNPEALDRLSLNGPRARGQGPQLNEAKLFYETLQEVQELADAMAAVGIPPEAVANMLVRVDEALAARSAQEVLTNVGRQNTALRNEIAREVTKFMGAFRGYLRMAAVEDPSILNRYNL